MSNRHLFHLLIAAHLFCLLLSGCTEKSGNTQSKDDEPKITLSSLPVLSLPFKAKLNGPFNLEIVSLESFPPFFENGAGIIGLMPDTSTYYGFVTYLSGADYPLLELKTFAKNGKPIDTQQLAYAKCGSGGGCGWECEDWVIIEGDGRFKNEVRITQSECDDEEDNPIPGTEKRTTQESAGKVDSQGGIEMN